jgi:hypothetical protein
MGGLLLILPNPLWVRTFELGVFLTAMFGTTAWILHPATGRHNQVVGKMGEELTGEPVLGHRRRRVGWRLANGLYFERHGYVDHVLVGPGGIFALESKWTSTPWALDQAQISGSDGRDPIAQARDGARKVERLLRYGPERFDVTVHPVVVVWGPGAPNHLWGGSRSTAYWS